MVWSPEPRERPSVGPWNSRRLHAAGDGDIEADLRLRPVPTSAGIARRFVASALAGWGRDHVVDVVNLLVSEVVTNAVLHARSDLTLKLSLREGCVRVEVSDSSESTPVLNRAADDALGGRGLALVDNLASDWGVQSGGGGKVVWFEVAP